MNTIHTADKPHRTSGHTSDDLQKRHLDLLEKIRTGYNFYFCPACSSHVSSQTPSGPYLMCGSSLWNTDSPLAGNIIDTPVLNQHMLETFRGCIGTFAVTGKQTWCHTSFLYPKDDGRHPAGRSGHETPSLRWTDRTILGTKRLLPHSLLPARQSAGTGCGRNNRLKYEVPSL